MIGGYQRMDGSFCPQTTIRQPRKDVAGVAGRTEQAKTEFTSVHRWQRKPGVCALTSTRGMAADRQRPAPRSRPKQERENTKPFYVYIDEYQKFITPKISYQPHIQSGRTLSGRGPAQDWAEFPLDNRRSMRR